MEQLKIVGESTKLTWNLKSANLYQEKEIELTFTTLELEKKSSQLIRRTEELPHLIADTLTVIETQWNSNYQREFIFSMNKQTFHIDFFDNGLIEWKSKINPRQISVFFCSKTLSRVNTWIDFDWFETMESRRRLDNKVEPNIICLTQKWSMTGKYISQKTFSWYFTTFNLV